MKITIKGTNIELTDSIRQYVNRKIDGLTKFANPPIECWVEVERTTRHHKTGDIFRAEAQIRLPGTSSVRAEATERDLYQAIDEVKDELQRQLARHKGKQIAQRRKT